MLPTFVIGLREGLEASLIVGIIAAFLVQRGDGRAMRWMWAGVAAAVALCLGVAVALRLVNDGLPQAQKEGLAAVLSLLAVAGITYMIVWMKRHSRELKRSLEAGAESALEAGAWAMVGMAFFAVIREGSRSELGTDEAPCAPGDVIELPLVEPHRFAEADAIARLRAGYEVQVVGGLPMLTAGRWPTRG